MISLHELRNIRPFNQLNGSTISAGFICERDWFLFAGLYYCEMTVEENVYKDVCKVVNIRNHIVCDKDINITTTNKTIDTNESTTKTDSIESTSDNENGSTVLIILILILIVIMALIGIGFYKIAKRRKKSEFLESYIE